MNACNTVSCEQQRLQPRAEREVREVGDIVVREIDTFVVFGDNAKILNRRDLVAFRKGSNESTSSCVVSVLFRARGKLGLALTSKIKLTLVEWIEV